MSMSMFAGLSSLAEGHKALLDDVSLGLGEGAPAGQPVDGVQHGVDHDGAVIAAGEQRRALGDERQHGGTQVAVQRQRHLSGAERHLEEEEGNQENLNCDVGGTEDLNCEITVMSLEQKISTVRLK